MKTQLSDLSALLDGELEDHEVGAVVRAAVRDDARRAAWQTYVLIGDRLRGERRAAPDLTAAVMAKIGEEPAVLAPRNLRRPAHRHPLLALAASVAGVAVVGWLALSGGPPGQPAVARLAAAPPAPSLAAAPAPAAGGAPRGEMSEYLLAHHTQAASFRLGDGVQQVRAVALTDRDERR